MKEYNNEEIEKRLKEKSLQGSSGKRTGQTTNIDKNEYRDRIKTIALIIAIAAGLIINANMNDIHKMQEEKIINDLNNEYNIELTIDDSIQR